MKFIKIDRGNDWGHVYYAPAGKALDAQGKASRTRGLQLEAGAVIRVRWPNGKVTSEKLVTRALQVRVPDMGRDYDLKTAEWGVEATFRGVKFFVDLAKLEVTPESIF